MIVSDGSGGAIVTWSDGRADPNAPDIYAQHARANGVIDVAWPANGRALCTAPHIQVEEAVVSDDTGGAIVAWHDERSGDYSTSDIYAQHVLAGGLVDPAWPTDGRALCTAPHQQLFPAVTEDGSGGAIVAWFDIRGGDYYAADVYAQHVLAGGLVDPAWPADGRALSTAPNGQYIPTPVPDGAGGAIVVWDDWRSGKTDIYAQRVTASGQLGGDQATATMASLVSVKALADRIRLVWYTAGAAGHDANLYRRTADGDWVFVGTVTPDGSGFLRYEDAAVMSGTRYGYQLGIMDAGEESFVGEAWAEVPALALQLALRVAAPNPSTDGRLRVEFALRNGRLARLELMDVAGRVLNSREVGSLGPGTHSVDISGGRPLRPGIYFLRLTQGGREVRARAAVTR